ncbi:hypothetical protein ACJX0J_020043 [Zea mays]
MADMDISGALWDEDTFVISLEEGHYAAYIKMMALKYMTDEDVAVEALILSHVTDLIQIFTSPFYLYLLFCHFSTVYNKSFTLDGLYLQCMYLQRDQNLNLYIYNLILHITSFRVFDLENEGKLRLFFLRQNTVEKTEAA